MRMHRNRRGLALLLSMLMAVTMAPSAAFANEQAEIPPGIDSGTVLEQTLPDPAIPDPAQTEEDAPAGEDNALADNSEPGGGETDGQTGTDPQEEAPFLTGLQFAMDNKGTTPIPLAPEFQKDTKEYTIELNDYDAGKNIYLKYTVNDSSVTAKLGNNQRPNDKELMKADQWNSFWIPVAINYGLTCELYKNDALQNNYTINMKYRLSLEELDAGESMSPKFTPDVKEYTATVDAEEQTFTFIPVAKIKAKTSSIIVGGTAYESGNNKKTPITIQIQWDENGEMRIPIEVTSTAEQMIASTYYLTLKQAKKTDVPDIVNQPQGGQKYVYTETNITPLEVFATANGTLSYQWFDNDKNSTEGGQAVAGATERTYTPTFETHDQTRDHYFYCEVTNTKDGVSRSVMSDVAKVRVLADPTPYDVRITYADGSPIPAEGIQVDYTKPESVPEFKIAFQSKAMEEIDEGGITYQCSATSKEGESIFYLNDTKEHLSLPNCNSEGSLSCYVFVEVNDEFYLGYPEEDIPFIICGTQVEKPGINLKTESELEYFVGTEPEAFSCQATRVDQGSGVETGWQWWVSEDGGENYRKASGEGASGTSAAGFSDQFPISYTPESSDKPLKRCYKCTVTNTMTNSKGGTYTSSEDSPVITVSFVEDGGVTGFKGHGSEKNPYQIVSVNDLELLRQMVNQEGKTMKGLVFRMEEDITLPEDWEPIGSPKPDAPIDTYTGRPSVGVGQYLNPFSGVFDGGDHTLTVPKNGKPLFGYARQTTVRNMALYGERIPSSGLVLYSFIDYGPTGNYNEYTKDGYPLTLAVDNVTIKTGTQILKSGFIGGGGSGANVVNIRNCTAEAGVIIGYDRQQSAIGSFAGQLSGTIQNCSSAAAVYGTYDVGGMAGAKQQSMGPCQVLNCSFTGSIEATGTEVGGIFGSGYDSESAPNTPCVTVKNCYVDAPIKGSSEVGGIFGAEPGCKSAWGNGAGFIQNNHFCGTVTATDRDGVVGGIVGYMASLNRYNFVTNNYFADTCGAAKAIGKLDYDQTGVDADLRGKAQPAASFQDGTVTKALNEGEDSFGNWIQGKDYPVHGEGGVWAETLKLSGYKTHYTALEEFTSEGIQATATMNDGTVRKVPVEEIHFVPPSFQDADSTLLFVAASYKGCNTFYRVFVSKPQDSYYANRVSELIEAIGEVTLGSREAIEAARAAYDELSDSQKGLVTNLNVLTAAEQKLAELQATPSGTPAPTDTPIPSGTPSGSGSSSGIQTPQPTEEPSITPEPTGEPTTVPEPSITPEPTDEPPKTTVIENPDGSKTEITESTVTNEDGSVVQTTETKNTDADGTVTGSTIKANISTGSEGKETSAEVNVSKDGTGAITSAKATISNPTASSADKALINGAMLKQITQAAGTDDVEITIQNGSGAKANTITANAADLTAGKKLNIAAKKANGSLVLVNAKTYTVARNGDLFVTIKGAGTYELLTGSRMNALSRQILQTVKAKNAKKTIKKSKTAKMALKKTLNMENVKSIRYSVSKKSIASVTKKGVIKAKKAGTAVVKAKVTLKNGRTKTVKMKIKVK